LWLKTAMQNEESNQLEKKENEKQNNPIVYCAWFCGQSR
jgi:hypothetical protein